jgi:transposase
MIALAPQMTILVAVAAVDFRRGIDGLARGCRERLASDPCSGTLFVVRNRRGTAIKILAYDGQGFLLTLKRLSMGRFRWWPTSAAAATTLEAHQRQRRSMGGTPAAPDAAPLWRRLRVPA